MEVLMIRTVIVFLFFSLFAYYSGRSNAETHFITLASTTSTQNSGLFDRILPIFVKKSGIKVRVVAVGTGQALQIARNGDADVLFVHHKPSEILFVERGFGVKRFDVMYNDFIIVGPKSDPAKISATKRAVEAFVLIARSRSNFVSRGDDSGTHKREKALWVSASIDLERNNRKWYREIGAGMGAALNTASAMNAYTLSDRGTWLNFKNKDSLDILFEGDQNLINLYGVILVNPEKHNHIRAKSGQIFINWLVSEEGQKAIDSYQINGKQLFFSNAEIVANRRFP
jgi:tungstate transport system substrate-binding protein